MVILSPLTPGILVLVGLVIVWCLMRWLFWREQRQFRASPLARDLLRPPGHSLRMRLAQTNEEIAIYLMMGLLIPLLSYAGHVSQSYFSGTPETVARIGFSILLAMLAFAFIAYRIVPLMKEQRNLTLGLEGELATGEELNQLMRDGCRVFHDIPCPLGNIDHVVVSRSGVYSVNTKCRSKNRQGKLSADVVVDNPNGIIRFPDGGMPIPEAPLVAEAEWLSQFLKESVGRPVPVEPMIALPGWKIKERIGRGRVYIVNPRNATRFFVRDRLALTPEVIQQVSHQLDQLCRDVEPALRENEKRWEDQSE